MVCHGGSGTTLAALASGVPLLVLPLEANQFWNADRTAALGAGEVLRAPELSEEAVRRAVARLLDDTTSGARAGALAEEIAAMPHPDEIVPLLDQLAEEAGGRPSGP